MEKSKIIVNKIVKAELEMCGGRVEILMTEFELITKKLGFNPLEYHLDKNAIAPEEDDTRVSPFSVLTLDEKLYLNELYRIMDMPTELQ